MLCPSLMVRVRAQAYGFGSCIERVAKSERVSYAPRLPPFVMQKVLAADCQHV